MGSVLEFFFPSIWFISFHSLIRIDFLITVSKSIVYLCASMLSVCISSGLILNLLHSPSIPTGRFFHFLHFTLLSSMWSSYNLIARFTYFTEQNRKKKWVHTYKWPATMHRHFILNNNFSNVRSKDAICDLNWKLNYTNFNLKTECDPSKCSGTRSPQVFIRFFSF